MLKPFRIKELNDPSPDRGLTHPANAKGEPPSFSGTVSPETYREVSSSDLRTSNDGVVRITEYQYEETISNNPEAKLSYLDEDDGEVVTVGSSLELKQRLDDPLPSFSPKAQLPGQNEMEPESMHIFDIRKSASVIDTWRGYQVRPYDGHPAQLPSSLDNNNNTLCSSSPPMNRPLSRGDGEADWENKNKGPVERWTAFCNPPRPSKELKLAGPEHKGDDYLLGLLESPKEASNSIMIPYPPNPIQSSGASSPSFPITEEGKKQAQAAGKKLRESRGLYQLQTPLFDAASNKSKENFWSSYQQTSNSEPLSQREPDSDESPIEEKPQPLLTAFESELSKLMKSQEQQPQMAGKAQDSSLNLSAITEMQVEPKLSANTSSTEHSATSPDIFGQAFQALIGRITQVTSELTSRLPEVEERLTSMQEQIPLHMQTTVQDTLKAMGCHVQTLSGIMQHATVSARSATNRTMEAENLFTAQVAGLRALADELRQVGQSLLEAFEAGRHQQNPSSSQPGDPSGTGVPNSSSARPSDVEHGLNSANEPTIPNASCIRGELPKESELMAPSSTLAKELPQAPLETNEGKLSSESEDSSQNTLLVSNLSSHTTEDKLRAALADKGFLGTVSLSRDSSTQKHLGFGTIQFPSPYAASGALKALSGACINGKSIDIEFLEGPPPNQVEKPAVEMPCDSQPTSLASDHRKALKTRPSVTFDVVDPSSSSGLRRAKSLGALRSHRGRRDAQHNPPQHAPIDNFPHQRPFDHHRPNRCVMRKRSLKHQNPHALLDQQDTNPDLSVRYPSLLNSKITGNAPFLDADSKFAMKPVGSRYLGSGSATNLSMEQLDGPSRSHVMPTVRSTPQNDDQLLDMGYSKLPTYQPSPPPVPDKLPGSWPWEYESQKWDIIGRHSGTYDEEESKTPLRRAKSTISRRPTQKPGVEITPSSLYDNPWATRTTQRQRHVRDLPSTYVASHERPEREPATSHRNDVPITKNIPNVPGTFPLEAQTAAALPNQPSAKIETCVKHLQTLGFETDGGQDAARLRIFAEAAKGRLEDAIEMIEEERKAYEEQRRFA